MLTSHTTINGNFFVKPTSTGSYNEGIRIYNAPDNWAGIGFGFHESDESLPSDGWWAAVNPSREFIISAGGSDNHLGLKLIKNGEAYWRNQEILHSGNVQNYKRSICDKYSSIRTSSGYTKLGVLPANAAETYDVFRITGSIGSWGSRYKSIVDLHISNRDGLSISGYIHNFGTEYWDIYVNDSLEIILYSRSAYTAWDIEISSFQSTIDYQPDYTPSNTNWITSAHSSDHVTKFDINGNLLNKAVNIEPDVLYKKYDQKSGSDTPFTYSYGLTMSSIYYGESSGWPINYGNAITARDTGTTQLIVTWNANQTADNPNVSQELFIRSQRDSAGDNSTIRIMGKYIPDIYYNFNNLLIIGEAKTLNDFERLHSREQFESYLTMCEMHLGKSVVVVSVPWQIVSTAKNYFKRLIREKNYTTEVIIINELGRCFKI